MNTIKKYLGLVDIVADTYQKPKVDVVADVMNNESQIKYRENFKEYKPMTVTYYLLAIGHTIKQYEQEKHGVYRF